MGTRGHPRGEQLRAAPGWSWRSGSATRLVLLTGRPVGGVERWLPRIDYLDCASLRVRRHSRTEAEADRSL